MSERIQCWCGEIYDSSTLVESHIVVDHMRGWLRYECIYCKMNHSGKTEKSTEHQLRKHIEDVHPGEKFQILSTPDIERENQLKNMMERSVEISSETTFDQMTNSQPSASLTPTSLQLPNISANQTFTSPVNMCSVKTEPIKVETSNDDDDVMILATPPRSGNIFEKLQSGEASANNSEKSIDSKPDLDKNICQICVKESLKRRQSCFETEENRRSHAKSHAARDSVYETRNGSLKNFMKMCFPFWSQNDLQTPKSAIPDQVETASRKRHSIGQRDDRLSKNSQQYCRKCEKNVQTAHGGMLAYHLFDVHIKENTVMCGYCDFGVSLRGKQVLSHLANKHKELPLKIIDKRREYSKRFLEERKSCFGIPLTSKQRRFPEWFDKSVLQ